MHEANFTEQIVNVILMEVAKYPDGTPKKVRVLVGDMLHLVPESVRAHYQAITRGTRLETATLELIEMPVQIRCQACGKTGGVEDHHLLQCTFCDSVDVRLLSGNEVLVESIEID